STLARADPPARHTAAAVAAKASGFNFASMLINLPFVQVAGFFGALLFGFLASKDIALGVRCHARPVAAAGRPARAPGHVEGDEGATQAR
ncbi:MAG: hypothetical protein R3322_21820, partial [Kiloniellales bacterium]|nr:hypothetical protein [Kiloniellales bacterium]